jgi:hypothetical protein
MKNPGSQESALAHAGTLMQSLKQGWLRPIDIIDSD